MIFDSQNKRPSKNGFPAVGDCAFIIHSYAGALHLVISLRKRGDRLTRTETPTGITVNSRIYLSLSGEALSWTHFSRAGESAGRDHVSRRFCGAREVVGETVRDQQPTLPFLCGARWVARRSEINSRPYHSSAGRGGVGGRDGQEINSRPYHSSVGRGGISMLQNS